MDFGRAKQEIMDWVIDFVEQPNTNLNGWPPCPHARKARLDDKFEIRPGAIDPYTDLMYADLGVRDVIAYVYDPDAFTSDRFNDLVDRVNQGFLLSRDIIALADHPRDHEVINGVSMNQGSYAIAFIQPLSKLNHYARIIAKKGYYDGWPEEYLQNLFRHRQDPRS